MRLKIGIEAGFNFLGEELKHFNEKAFAICNLG
jgi:hypothetical protein